MTTARDVPKRRRAIDILLEERTTATQFRFERLRSVIEELFATAQEVDQLRSLPVPDNPIDVREIQSLDTALDRLRDATELLIGCATRAKISSLRELAVKARYANDWIEPGRDDLIAVFVKSLQSDIERISRRAAVPT
jgi:hypothetical protein